MSKEIELLKAENYHLKRKGNNLQAQLENCEQKISALIEALNTQTALYNALVSLLNLHNWLFICVQICPQQAPKHSDDISTPTLEEAVRGLDTELSQQLNVITSLAQQYEYGNIKDIHKICEITLKLIDAVRSCPKDKGAGLKIVFNTYVSSRFHATMAYREAAKRKHATSEQIARLITLVDKVIADNGGIRPSWKVTVSRVLELLAHREDPVDDEVLKSLEHRPPAAQIEYVSNTYRKHYQRKKKKSGTI